MSLHHNLEKRLINGQKGYGIFVTSSITLGDLVMVDEGVILTNQAYFSLFTGNCDGCSYLKVNNKFKFYENS